MPNIRKIGIPLYSPIYYIHVDLGFKGVYISLSPTYVSTDAVSCVVFGVSVF